MAIKASWHKHVLDYFRPARTSRGAMDIHTVYYIVLENGARCGYGEAAPLPGLSMDNLQGIEEKMNRCCGLINDGLPPEALPLEGYPAVRFAFETAVKALASGDPFTLYQTDFLQGAGIPVNGLVWMDTKDEMLKQALEKAEQGFSCIKFKIGALDFDEECRMLESFRKIFNAFKIEIRLDANGAFSTDDVFEKLKELNRFDVHSLEQPVKAGQPGLMQEVCSKSKIAIALDEELIGVPVETAGAALLEHIRPAYLILKPTLLGGLGSADAWVDLCEKSGTGWWATSALESNIGLNAIAQWVFTKQPSLAQGLGTGALYRNNIDSPLHAARGKLFYERSRGWGKLPG